MRRRYWEHGIDFKIVVLFDFGFRNLRSLPVSELTRFEFLKEYTPKIFFTRQHHSTLIVRKVNSNETKIFFFRYGKSELVEGWLIVKDDRIFREAAGGEEGTEEDSTDEDIPSSDKRVATTAKGSEVGAKGN